MSSNVVRIFGDALPSQAGEKAGAEQIQLDLFDHPRFRYILCLPMLELHGDTFVRLISKYRPSAVLDLRSHPYFGRPALDRAIAFDLFEKSSSMYIHRAFELKAPEDQQGYWKLRSEAANIFSKELEILKMDRGITLAVLLHRGDEIDVLAQAIRQIGDSLSWYLISPKSAP